MARGPSIQLTVLSNRSRSPSSAETSLPNPGVVGHHPRAGFPARTTYPGAFFTLPSTRRPSHRRRCRRRRCPPGSSPASRRTRRHSWNLVCTFILPPSTFPLPTSRSFALFLHLSLFLFSSFDLLCLSPPPALPPLFDSLSQLEWHGTAGNKWPLMDFLDVRSRAAELRCSQECSPGPPKYGGTLNYWNRWLSSHLSLSLSPPASLANVWQITAARSYRRRWKLFSSFSEAGGAFATNFSSSPIIRATSQWPRAYARSFSWLAFSHSQWIFKLSSRISPSGA